MKKLSINGIGILAALLAVSAALSVSLSSCGADNGDKNTATTAGTDTTAAVTTSAEESIYSSLPTGDYTGKTFRILTTEHNWASSNIIEPELTGENLSDAKYNRALAVSEKLGVQFEETLSTVSQVQTEIQKQFASQDNTYDMFTASCPFAYQSAKNGYVLDISEIPGIDLSQPWWAQKYNESVNLEGKYYIAFGDISLVYHGAFYTLQFNKKIVTDLGLEDPYDLVDSKQWTWDKMYEMMQAAQHDVNGDGVYDFNEDTVGLCGHRVHFKHFMVTADAYLVTKDADGVPVYNGISEKYATAFEKLVNYFMKNPAVAIDSVSSDGFAKYTSKSSLAKYRDIFVSGRSLFLTDSTGSLYMLRDTDVDYGVIMFPQYEANWNDIYTSVYSQTTGVIIPYTTEDKAYCGTVIENLCALSHDTSRSEFVNTTLNYKYLRDQRSIDMVNMIFDNGVVDTAFAFDWGSVSSAFDTLLTEKSINIMSSFKRRESVIAKAIEDTLNTVAK